MNNPPEPVDWDEDAKAAVAAPLKARPFRPLGENVLLKRLTNDVVTDWGFELLEQYQSSRCQVVRLGADVPEWSCLDPGDLVDLGEWDPKLRELKVNGEPCIIAHYSLIQYKVTES